MNLNWYLALWRMHLYAKARYGAENDIRAEIDTKTGDTILKRFMEVVEDVENDNTQLTLDEARKLSRMRKPVNFRRNQPLIR